MGGQCTSDSQCSSVTPNAVCNNSVCTCVPPLTSYLNLACIHGESPATLPLSCTYLHPCSYPCFLASAPALIRGFYLSPVPRAPGSGIGDMCYNDAQCRALNNFSFCRLSVAEVVGVCTCDPDQFIDSRGKCVPRLGKFRFLLLFLVFVLLIHRPSYLIFLLSAIFQPFRAFLNLSSPLHSPSRFHILYLSASFIFSFIPSHSSYPSYYSPIPCPHDTPASSQQDPSISHTPHSSSPQTLNFILRAIQEIFPTHLLFLFVFFFIWASCV